MKNAGKLEKIKQLNIFWRKIILFSIMAILAVPIAIFVFSNFSLRMQKTKNEQGFGKVGMPKVKSEQELKNVLKR